MGRFGVYVCTYDDSSPEEYTESVSSEEEDDSDWSTSSPATSPPPEPTPKRARASRQTQPPSSRNSSSTYASPSSPSTSTGNCASGHAHSCRTTGCTGSHFYSDSVNSFRVFHNCNCTAGEAGRDNSRGAERVRRAEKERREREREQARRREKERLRREAEERDYDRRHQEQELRKEREEREKRRREELERRKREREEEARKAKEESDTRQYYRHKWEARFAQARARARAHPYAQAKASHSGPGLRFDPPNPFGFPPSYSPPLRRRPRQSTFSSTSPAASGSKSQSSDSTDSVHDMKKYSKDPQAYFEWYDSAWTEINAQRSTSSLSFSEIPWAVVPFPRSPEDITTAKVKSFVRDKHSGDPGLKEEVTVKERRAAAKKELLNWHPDKFARRVLDRVADPAKREAVSRAADVVQKALTEYMREAGSG